MLVANIKIWKSHLNKVKYLMIGNKPTLHQSSKKETAALQQIIGPFH